MARARLRPDEVEPAIIRLRLELDIDRQAAAALINAGYLTAEEVAAADDAQYLRGVRLPRAKADEVLRRARAPGALQIGPGKPPPSTRRDLSPRALAKAARPVTRVVAKALGEREAPPRSSAGTKPAPPYEGGDRSGRHSLISDAEEAERAIEAQLRKRKA